MKTNSEILDRLKLCPQLHLIRSKLKILKFLGSESKNKTNLKF